MTCSRLCQNCWRSMIQSDMQPACSVAPSVPVWPTHCCLKVHGVVLCALCCRWYSLKEPVNLRQYTHLLGLPVPYMCASEHVSILQDTLQAPHPTAFDMESSRKSHNVHAQSTRRSQQGHSLCFHATPVVTQIFQSAHSCRCCTG